MTAALIGLVVVLALALVAIIVRRRSGPARRPGPEARPGARGGLFPFVASGLSRPVLDAALRIARAEEATLVPVFLPSVPMNLPLDSPLPRPAGGGAAPPA